MRDRLSEFQSRITDQFDEVELGPRPHSAMERIDNRLQDVRKAMELLRNEIDNLKTKQTRILAQTLSDPRDKDVLEEQIAQIRRRTLDLRKLVREVDNDFVEFARQSHSQAEVRIRKNQLEQLKKKAMDLIYFSNDTHDDYRRRVSHRVRRQLQAVGEDLTEQEVDAILDKTDAEQIYFGQVSGLSVSGKAAMEEVKQRHNEIVELEKSISLLQEIFVDMQNLVESQGDMVDNIEKNVSSTQIHVEQGAQNVHSAVEYKKSALRKKICVITTLIIIVLLIILAIVLAIVLSRK